MRTVAALGLLALFFLLPHLPRLRHRLQPRTAVSTVRLQLPGYSE